MTNMDFSLEVRAEPRLLCTVRSLVRSYLDSFEFAKDRIDEAVLAIDEACTNAIRHAYRGRADQTYRIEVRARDGWVEFSIQDDGEPAPAEAVSPKTGGGPPALDELKPGGLGVQLIYDVFDEVEFCSGKSRGNCVRMKLRLPKRA